MQFAITRVAVPRRAGVMIGATLAGTLATAGPAHANYCFPMEGWYLQNGVLSGYAQRECVNPETVTPMDVVFRRDYSATYPGDERYAQWVLVVKTRCNGSYRCRNQAGTRWKFNGAEVGPLACG